MKRACLLDATSAAVLRVVVAASSLLTRVVATAVDCLMRCVQHADESEYHCSNACKRAGMASDGHLTSKAHTVKDACRPVRIEQSGTSTCQSLVQALCDC